MSELILIGGGVLVAAIYPFMWWLSRRLYPPLRPRARIAVAVTVVPPIRSPRPVAGGQQAIGTGPRVVQGEVAESETIQPR